MGHYVIYGMSPKWYPLEFYIYFRGKTCFHTIAFFDEQDRRLCINEIPIRKRKKTNMTCSKIEKLKNNNDNQNIKRIKNKILNKKVNIWKKEDKNLRQEIEKRINTPTLKKYVLWY